LWNLDQPRSLTMCSQYRVDGATCDVLPDALVAQIAASAPLEKPLPQATTDEGSDSERPPPPPPPQRHAKKIKIKR
jgi:hypothetical protein